MDFNDTPEEAKFRAETRAFLDKNLRPKSRGREPGAGGDAIARSKVYQKAKAEAGFAGLTWPKEHGGRGLSAIFQVIFGEEEGKYEPLGGPFIIGLGMCVPTIIQVGTDEQKKRFIGKALTGEEIWCQLFSEPSAGSDVAASRTRAVKQGEDWIVNGQKVWTSGAHFSDWGLLLTRTDPDQPKHKGLTMFIVNMKDPGLEVRPIHQMSGGSNFNEVYFSDVRIPDAMRVGAAGDGWKVALVTLMNERLAVGGSPGPDYPEILELARGLSGPSGQGTLLQDQAFRQRLADWYVSAEGYKLGRFRTMTALSKGAVPGPESSIGKVINANRLQDITNAAIEAQGHAGIVTGGQDDVFGEAYMWAPGLRIAGGSDEILKNIIAERVLGLPQDPRADKDLPFKDLPTGR